MEKRETKKKTSFIQIYGQLRFLLWKSWMSSDRRNEKIDKKIRAGKRWGGGKYIEESNDGKINVTNEVL